MSPIRYPNRSQLARPMQFRQHLCIAAVGLHPVAGLHRNERRGDDHTIMPEAGELPMEAIAARTCLIAKVQQTPAGTQLLGKLADMIGAVGEVPQWRTSLQRPPRAMATEIVDLWTSSPTNRLFSTWSLPHS